MVLTSDFLREPSACMSRKRDTISTVAKGVKNTLMRIRLYDPRHHIVAHIDPAPPGISNCNILEYGKLSGKPQAEQIKMLGRLSVYPMDRTAAANLKPVVGQKPIIKSQGSRIRKKCSTAHSNLREFIFSQRPCNH
jgi:hypothetical protein